ncbi:MAG: hypothetical protein ACM30H_14400, partial [Clostridia bacterium]
MKPDALPPRRIARQTGQVLIALLAVVLMGISYFLVSRLNATSTDYVTAKRQRNAKVLNQAKQALIGYVIAHANKVGENNPGALPCPEDPADFDGTTSRQGLAGTGCASSVKVGRFPWGTLGLDRLVDADSEPLWYVVSPNFGVATAPYASINSNSQGQLTVDGVANAAIALIIAPGAAINAQSATGCTAWNQSRPLTGTPDWRNYLECDNATSPADTSFVTTGPSGSGFNDQVMVVTPADLMPGLEAAIADRMSREIAPLVKSAYAAVSAWNLTASAPIFPFAAPFADPSTSP